MIESNHSDGYSLSMPLLMLAIQIPTVVRFVELPVPLSFVNDTISGFTTGVRQLLSNCSLEEALAPLAAVHPVVLA